MSGANREGAPEREESATEPYVRTATTVPVVASSPWAGGIYAGDYTTQNPPTLLPGSEGDWVKFLTEDGHYLLGATTKRLRCWKLPEGRLISEMRMPEGYNSVSCAALTPDGSRTVVTTQVPTRTLTVYDTFLGARLSWEPMDPRFAIKWLEPGTGARTLAFGRNDGISGLAQF